MRTNLNTSSEPASKRVRLGTTITKDFVDHNAELFRKDPMNILARNTVATCGIHYSSLDTDQANKISHVFLNSVKPTHIRATNQEASGRCWMFAGLNVFRYILIKALDLENFEFSETYLFFYDKLERANYIIQYFIDHPELDPNDRIIPIMLKDRFEDGGYWNYFTNLVNKYGLVPKEAMNETFNSGWTSDMNTILCERIIACCNKIMKIHSLFNNNNNNQKLLKLKNKTMSQIYSSLVKFLGQPPEKFDWSFTTVDKNTHCICDLTPDKFKNMILSNIDINDYVTLCNIPCKDYYEMYQVKDTNNVVDGNPCLFLNLPIHELKKYAKETINRGLPVWFAGDVGKGFSQYKSVLDDKIYNTDLLFGSSEKWDKSEKVRLGFTTGSHAMVITGFNQKSEKPFSWQVENSWGYYDHEVPGLDGFLTMSDEWFSNNLIQLVVHKKFLTRNVSKVLEKEPHTLDPWDYTAPALKIRTHNKNEFI